MHVAVATADGGAIENSERTTFFLAASGSNTMSRASAMKLNCQYCHRTHSGDGARSTHRRQARTATKSTNNDIRSIALTTHLQINVHQGKIARRSRITSRSTQL
jgi:hypothetical protein